MYVKLSGKVREGQLWAATHVWLLKYSDELDAHFRHIVVKLMHSAQGYSHGLHCLSSGTVPVGQLELHVFPYKFNVLHDVQFVRVTEQVAQSPSHGTATPDMFRYPSGTLDRHFELRSTKPGSHTKHTVGDEQFLQPMLSA